MGFNIYQKEELGNGNIRLKKAAASTLSGPDGLIAKYISSHKTAHMKEWSFSATEIPSVVGLPNKSYVVIYTSYDESLNTLNISTVNSVKGTSTEDKSEVELHLSLIESIEKVSDPVSQSVEIDFSPSDDFDPLVEPHILKGGWGSSSFSWRLLDCA